MHMGLSEKKNTYMTESDTFDMSADNNGNGDKLERSKYTYDLVNSWIDNADNKVSVSCAIFTGAFGVITFLSEKVSTSQTINQCWRCCYHITFIVSVVFLMASLLFYVLAINPNLGKGGVKKTRKMNKKKYPIFFGDIAELELSEYKNLMNRGTDQDFINELHTETHYNSRVCITKMKNYRIGLWLSFMSIVISMGSWFSHYMMYR